MILLHLSAYFNHSSPFLGHHPLVQSLKYFILGWFLTELSKQCPRFWSFLILTYPINIQQDNAFRTVFITVTPVVILPIVYWINSKLSQTQMPELANSLYKCKHFILLPHRASLLESITFALQFLRLMLLILAFTTLHSYAKLKYLLKSFQLTHKSRSESNLNSTAWTIIKLFSEFTVTLKVNIKNSFCPFSVP